MSLQRSGVRTRVRGMRPMMDHPSGSGGRPRAQYRDAMSEDLPPENDMPGSDGPPGLDLPAVTAWLDTHRPGLLADRPTATLVAGGRSNLTYVLDGGSRRLVLRRPPLGHVLAT